MNEKVILQALVCILKTLFIPEGLKYDSELINSRNDYINSTIKCLEEVLNV